MTLPEGPTRARNDLVVTAPDGIAVHPVELPGLRNMSLAEGRLPPGEFGVHYHRTLEQITYVLAGRLVVTMADPATGETADYSCVAGDTITTPPLTTLSYRNPGPDLARVLFICAPPYPADDAGTVTLERHRPLGSDERRAMNGDVPPRVPAGVSLVPCRSSFVARRSKRASRLPSGSRKKASAP